MSSEMAWRAASLISSGAAKSGKPCDKLTALCFIASRVISRITDSVNCWALDEIMRREISAIEDSGELILLRETRARLQRPSYALASALAKSLRVAAWLLAPRSEERRVGKGCGAGWAQAHGEEKRMERVADS